MNTFEEAQAYRTDHPYTVEKFKTFIQPKVETYIRLPEFTNREL